ncbi:phosphatase PAP2 family protein [Streptomyces triticagri]|uniref:Phosphatase PAP2 family protein n=2 Tax=Streptomyces triticagri TaxID=2293568 RepID=A0A372LYY5_9ACTN|nr:phosphatase PAP2 family protein [Streptomyces triticagri]RFU83882.1 phosphatase PAP2 family protein [Streptomyces triticagri]
MGPDADLLHGINGLAKDAPDWVDSVVGFVGEWGLPLAMVLLVLWCWTTVRRRPDAETSVAALVWAPLAAGIALLVNIPIREFVERRRPFYEYNDLEVLADGKTDFSFVSDHATLAMALGVGLFVAHRKFGLIGIGLALLEGFCRVYMGVHYPTDVIGGFALGTAVTLLLAPVAMALLTPLTRAVARSGRWGRLVSARGARRTVPGAVELPEPQQGRDAEEPGRDPARKDLAA